jgi:CO dehydrogenase maturation factor
VRIAVVGKGGAGKSVIAGTLARVLAAEGRRVLALDSDLLPGLASSLGADAPAEPPLAAAAERDDGGRWRLRKGVGPVRAVQRYSTPAPDGIRLLQCGKLSAEGLDPIGGSVRAFYKVVHRLADAETFRDWTMLGDLPAGPRQTAFDWAPYADAFLLVVEPTWKSALTARRIARIARSRRPDVGILPVANKIAGAADSRRVEELLSEPLLASVPADDSVVAVDRLGVALIDHAPSSPAALAIHGLVDRLASQATATGTAGAGREGNTPSNSRRQ